MDTMPNKNNSKQKAVLIAVIVIAIIAIAAIYWSSMSAPAPAGTASPLAPSGGGTLQTGTSTLTFTSTISQLPASGAATPTSTMWQQYLGKQNEIIVSYPPGWTLGPNTPISMDNFEHAYAADGSIPLGGAEIDIATTTVYGSEDTLIASQLSSGTITSTSTVSVSGTSCKEYFYNNSYAPGVPSKNVAVYCLRGTTLFEIYLSYRAADPNGAQYVGMLGQVLSRIQFTGK